MARLTVDQTLERAALRVLSDSLTQEVDPVKVENARLMISTIKARRVEQAKERQRAAWRKSKRKAAAAAKAEAKERREIAERIKEATTISPEGLAQIAKRDAERAAKRQEVADEAARIEALRQQDHQKFLREQAEEKRNTNPDFEAIRREQERQERLLRMGEM